ncbi:MAG: phosphatidate cytidylyltransferase [Eubacteriales bacterium]|nr:phosphatidate cytidylyltransferase [Eubacteriales bacterium]
MKTRILSGFIMLPFLAVVYFGGTLLLVACLIIAMIGIREFYHGYKQIGVRPSIVIGYISVLSLYGIGFFQLGLEYMMFWFFGVVVASLLYLFKIEERQLVDAMATITGAFYIVFFSYHVVLIDQKEGTIFVWLVLLTAFGTDISAYFTGYTIGKHKLCPKISPKKTIEGAIGGVVGSVILCGLFGYFFINSLLPHCLFIGFLGSVISQFGDLNASIFKRKMGIKDYGNLIPGHGGILDRFDSVLFTAPFVYYYIALVIY